MLALISKANKLSGSVPHGKHIIVRAIITKLALPVGNLNNHSEIRCAVSLLHNDKVTHLKSHCHLANQNKAGSGWQSYTACRSGKQHPVFQDSCQPSQPPQT